MRNGDNTDADYDDTDYENDENDDTDDADTDDVDVKASSAGHALCHEGRDLPNPLHLRRLHVHLQGQGHGQSPYFPSLVCSCTLTCTSSCS